MITDNLFTETQQLKWKQKLKAACISIIQQRISNTQHAMQQAQESANNEDKSSAGDKHETSRAMSQIDRDMHARQLEDAKRELQLINSINAETIVKQAGPGAFVQCKEYSFFISLGLGTTIIEGHKIVLLSAQAPMARLLDNKKGGDKFELNGKTIEITDVF